MAGAIQYKLGIDGSALRAGLAGARGAISGFMGSAAKLGGLAGSLVGVGGAALAMKNAITGAADMESMETAFETLIGSAEGAQQVLTGLKAFASSTPFEFPEIAAAARNLIAMGSGAGSVTDELRMIGDVASGTGMPLGNLAAMFAKMRSSEVIHTDDLNQLADTGILKQLSADLGKSGSEIRKLAEEGQIGFPAVQAAFQKLTSEGGRFFEMTKKQSTTAHGLWSTLKDGINEVLREFGKPILMSLKTILTEGIALTGGLIAKAREWGAVVAGAISGIKAMWDAGGFMAFLPALKAGLKVVFGEAVNFIVSTLVDGLVMAAKLFATAMGAAMKAIWDGEDTGAAVDAATSKTSFKQPIDTTTAKVELALALAPLLKSIAAAKDAAKPKPTASDAADAIAPIFPGLAAALKQAFTVELPKTITPDFEPAQKGGSGGGGNSTGDALSRIGGTVGSKGATPKDESKQIAKHTYTTTRILTNIEKHMAKGNPGGKF